MARRRYPQTVISNRDERRVRGDLITSRRRRYRLDQDNAADCNQGLPAARYDAQQPLLLLIGTLLLALLAIPTGFLGVLQIPLVREHRRSVVKVQTQAI